MDTATKNLAARYDAASARWQEIISPLGYPAAYGELISRLGKIDAKTLDVLNAGAGSAAFSSAFIARHGTPNSLTLRDISADMLREAKRYLRGSGVEAKCVIGDIESLKKAREYNLILCAHVIEHCPAPIMALKALRRALRPEGALVLVVSKLHWCTALIRLIWRSKAFRPKKMQALLAAAGFDRIKTYEFTTGPPSRTSMGYIAILTEKKHDHCDG